MTLRQTAYHEAGHALAAFELGVTVKSVSIVADEHSWGHVISGGMQVSDWARLGPRMRDRLERRIIVSLAGREAARLVTKRYDNTGARQDYRSALRTLIHMVGNSEEATAYFRWLEVRARNFVRAEHRRVALDAIAGALVKQKTISGSEIQQIIISAYRNAAKGRT